MLGKIPPWTVIGYWDKIKDKGSPTCSKSPQIVSSVLKMLYHFCGQSLQTLLVSLQTKNLTHTPLWSASLSLERKNCWVYCFPIVFSNSADDIVASLLTSSMIYIYIQPVLVIYVHVNKQTNTNLANIVKIACRSHLVV